MYTYIYIYIYIGRRLGSRAHPAFAKGLMGIGGRLLSSTKGIVTSLERDTWVSEDDRDTKV